VSAAAAEAPKADRALDFAAVSEELAQLGIVRADGAPYSERQVRRMADEDKLPFFKAPDRQRLIMRSTLLDAVNRWQVEASRRASQRRAEAERARRPRGRA
jgi:hypothetical protein